MPISLLLSLILGAVACFDIYTQVHDNARTDQSQDSYWKERFERLDERITKIRDRHQIQIKEMQHEYKAEIHDLHIEIDQIRCE